MTPERIEISDDAILMARRESYGRSGNGISEWKYYQQHDIYGWKPINHGGEISSKGEMTLCNDREIKNSWVNI